MLDRVRKIIFPFFVIFMISIKNSYAYIDPGTGSFILQAILALGASIVFYLGYPIRLFKSMMNKIFKKKNEDKKK